MSWTSIAAADVAPQRWKNDGGWTRELLAWPHARDWVLRFSVADIERDGPFSAFPGVQRWIAVLEGSGISLAGQPLHPGDAPWPFDGALAPHCRLLGGATRDFNLMHRRGQGRVDLRAATLAHPLQAEGADFVALFSSGGGELVHGGRAMRVPAQGLAWCEQPAEQGLHFVGSGAPAWWLRWWKPQQGA
jgi:environmental stress-induced protein Ves